MTLTSLELRSLVTPEGDVQNRILHTDRTYTQTQLLEASNFFNQHYAGQPFHAIRALLALAPRSARRMRADGGEEEVSLDAIAVGDRLRVRPGEKVPVDGELVDGRAAVDQSMVTGESMPVTKAAGDKLVGGSLNRIGSFVMRAEHVGGDTLLSRIVQQYPRTDAAAAATVALSSIADSERHKIMADVIALRAQVAAQQKQIAALGPRVDELAARPIPQPAPPPAPKKKGPAKKKTTKKRRR